MQRLTIEQFTTLVDNAVIKPRLKRELRFVASTRDLNDDRWSSTELLAVHDRTDNKGVLLIQPDNTVFVVAYELTQGFAARSSGRAQPIICDFCRTWQRGSNAASITLQPDYRSGASTTFLCCADLDCSRHVRTLTNAAQLSRAQLREDLNDDGRVARLKDRLRDIVQQLTS